MTGRGRRSRCMVRRGRGRGRGARGKSRKAQMKGSGLFGLRGWMTKKFVKKNNKYMARNLKYFI